MEVDLVQNIFAFLITEGYIFEVDCAFDWRQLVGVRRILDGRHLVQCFEDALQIGRGSDQGIIEVPDIDDGIPEIVDVADEGDQCSGRNGHTDLTDAHKIDKAGRQYRNIQYTGPHQELDFDGFHPRRPVFLADFIEDVIIDLFAGKRLGDFDSRNAFVDIGVEVGLFVAQNLKGYPLALFDEQHQSEENWQKSHAVKRQAHIDEKHEAQCDHYIEQ